MPTLSLDAQLLLLINRGAANPLFDVLMPLLSYQGYLLVIPFLFYMLIRGYQHTAVNGKRYVATAIAAFVVACLAVYCSDWIEHAMKNAIARPRPCRTLENIRLITPCPKSYSMPSGHAFSSFAFAVPLFHLTRHFISMAWRLFPVSLAFLIALSRLYLGVHYPTDILLGGVLGTGAGLGLAYTCELTATKLFVGRRNDQR